MDTAAKIIACLAAVGTTIAFLAIRPTPTEPRGAAAIERTMERTSDRPLIRTSPGV